MAKCVVRTRWTLNRIPRVTYEQVLFLSRNGFPGHARSVSCSVERGKENARVAQGYNHRFVVQIEVVIIVLPDAFTLTKVTGLPVNSDKAVQTSVIYSVF